MVVKAALKGSQLHVQGSPVVVAKTCEALSINQSHMRNVS